MEHSIRLGASLLAADFADLAHQLDEVASCGVDAVHLDVMDGHFVNNITMGPAIAQAVHRLTVLPVKVHLMIENPGNYFRRFIDSGASALSFHVEAEPYPRRLLSKIRVTGRVNAGVALNPKTPVDSIEYLLDLLDFVLIMTVEPGFSGQKFIQDSLQKIAEAKRLIQRKRATVRIAVDGGISPENVASVVEAGADTIISGSAIFGHSDLCRAVQELRDGIRRGERKTA